MKKRLPIGISDFKKLIEEDYAYVDKTLLVQELVEKGANVTLIPRLRRFGKTLNLSMLRYFFEKSEQDTSYLFQSLKIWQDEKCKALQGQFPVIFLTLKDIKRASWEATFESLQGCLAMEFERHRYLVDSNTLSAEEKEVFVAFLRQKAGQSLTEQSLVLLTKWLHRYHQKRVVLLIDEYDTPAHAAYIGGFYKDLISFLRNWLSAGLKDNPCLERGVLTGILRIAKETIFSGLNNISIFTILQEGFQDKFGLLESEVKELLEEYNLVHHLDSIREWYNGYRIGTCTHIYNPWSVLNCIENKGALAPYWVNTSDNALMKRLIAQGTDHLKADVEQLMKGGIVEKTIEEGFIFSDLEKNPDIIWSLLLFSGYLTIDAPASYGKPCLLKIPNLEIWNLYQSMVLEWFKTTIHEAEYKELLNSLTNGNIEIFSQIFQEFLLSSVSVFDVAAEEPEKIYHAFVLGMLVGLKDRYEIKSNRESGYGRYDVMLIPKNLKDLGLVLEFKKIGRFEKIDLETAAASALKQIEDKKYVQELRDRGVTRILCLGLAFAGKQVLIKEKFV